MQSQTNFRKTVDFSGHRFFNGIDVHKRQWTVTTRVDGTYLKTYTLPPSPQALAKYLKTNYPNGSYFSVYEAGFCGTSYHTELCALGINNIIINPADLPLTNKLKTNRTDCYDSRALAEFLEAGKLNPIHIFPVDHQELRSLCRFRGTKQTDTARSKNRIKSMLMYYGITIPEQFQGKRCWSRLFVNWLKELNLTTAAGTTCLQHMISDLEYHRTQQLSMLRTIRKTLIQCTLDKRVDLLRSIPGVGPISAITLISEIGDMSRFKSEAHLSSFIGLLPSESSSDQNITVNGINPRCNTYLRTILIEDAWVAIRYSPSLLAYYKKHAYSNNSKKAIVKVARKLAMIIRAVWLSGKPFEETYQTNKLGKTESIIAQ
jgi:transposase